MTKEWVCRGVKGAKSSEGVIVDYDKFIIQKINEFPVTFRPKSGADDRILQISLDGTQGIRHVKAKVYILIHDTCDM